ncbi:MAG: hypothetical protein Q9222_004882 [Ikaeria aurantiellina]
MAEWQPHPSLSEDLTSLIRRIVESIPPTHLEPPATGERFDDADAVANRLQNYAFSQGFAMVTGSCGKGRKTYLCKHHGTKTKNIRKLDDTPSKDGSTNRKHQVMNVHAKGCNWRCASKATEVDGVTTWRLKVPKGPPIEHSHELEPNPLIYDEHRRRLPDRSRAMELAAAHRRAGLTFSQSARVLAEVDARFDKKYYLDRKKYYNLVPPSALPPDVGPNRNRKRKRN